MHSLSAWCVVLILDASLKAGLLAIVAVVLLRSLRLKDSNLRHRVWTGVLAGMLILPFVSQIVPALRLPFLSEPAFLNRESWLAQRDDSAADLALPEQKERTVSRNFTAEAPTAIDASWAGGNASTREMAAPPAERTSPTGDNSQRSAVPPLPATRPVATPAASAKNPGSRGRWLVAIFCTWLVGFVIAALWLLFAMASLRWLRSRSVRVMPAELSAAGLPRELANLNGRPLRVLECPLIRVPLSVGLFRPTILLPCDWLTWDPEKLSNVFAHERTHIARGDCAVIVLAEINRCLYWFHPIAWWLRLRLSSLAEEVCDDAAIGSSGSRTVYARHLLEVASVLAGQRSRLVPTALSMARQSNVEERIDSILNVGRPLSKRLSRLTSAVLLAAIAVTVGLAAALQPTLAEQRAALRPNHAERSAPVLLAANDAAMKGPASPGMKGASMNAAKGAQGNREDADSEKLSGPRKYSGHVTDVKGRPIGRAKLLIVWGNNFSEETGGVREVAESDDKGDFAFVLTPQVWEEAKLGTIAAFPRLVARAPHYSLDWMNLEAFAEQAPAEKRKAVQEATDRLFGAGRFASRSLRLSPEGPPIQGRLVDLEGRPLANVSVSAEAITLANIETVLQALKRHHKSLLYKAYKASAIAGDPLRQLMPPTTTDSHGQFTFAGVGPDRILTLTFRREGIESPQIYVLDRDMQPARLPQIEFYPNGYQDFYAGRNFTYAIGPSVPVAGVVKDYDSGQPVPNTVVGVERLFSEEGKHPERLRLNCSHLRAVTDSQGRFRIAGIPPGENHVLQTVAPAKEPYLISDKEISPKLGEPETPIEIRIKKVLWYEGQITDKATGKPVKATVDYLALRSNPNTLDKLGLRQGWRWNHRVTGSDGRYRVAGLPGPGVLLVRAASIQEYPRAIGADKVPGYQARNMDIPTTPIGLPTSNWNLIANVDPAKDAKVVHRDLVLDAGHSVIGRVVGPKNEPVSNLQVIGEVLNNGFWTSQPDSTFKLRGYDGKGPRQLHFKAADEKLVGHCRIEGPAPKEIVVKLEPAVRVTGRLIERETALPAERYEIYCDKPQLGEFRVDVTTGDDGRFEIKGLAAGYVYKMDAANQRRFSNNKNRFEIDLKKAKPGDSIDLGDVGGVTAKKL